MIEALEDISASQFPEADYGSLVHFIELKKAEAILEVRDFQWELKVQEFERKKHFFLMAYCAIASVVGAMVGVLVFFGLSYV